MRFRVALLCALVSSTAFAANEFRPISDAERAAVQVAAAYLGSGAEAVYGQLATASPLRQLGKEDALAEIEVRLGPPAGATWELQTVVPALKDSTGVFNISYPSGADETVTMDLAPENGTYKILNLRILAEPSLVAPVFPPMESAAAAAPAARPGDPNMLPLATGVVACVLAAFSAFIAGKQRRAARVTIALAIVAVAGGTYLAYQNLKSARTAVSMSTSRTMESFPRLGKLLLFRRAIAAGTDVTAAAPPVAMRGVAADVAKLWNAQLDLQQMHVESIARALGSYPSPSQTPLAEILRGRVAFVQAKETDTAISYENAVSLGPGRDGLWMETAQALETLGFTDRAESYFQRLARIGSRDANVYYSLAVLAAIHNHEDQAEKALQTAWTLRPVVREQLVGTGALWSTLRRPGVNSQIKVSAASEATFASPAVSTRPIILPPDAQTRVSGEFLDIQIRDAELAVPGGACLAPPGTTVVDAGAWSRVEEGKSLGEFAQLTGAARNSGSYTQPLLRRRIMRCAEALAAHNRWSDLLQLSEGLSPASEHVPAELFFLRDMALQRMQRTDEARQLLLDLTRSPALQRRNDPQLFIELGDMLASVDLFDPAIKVLDHAVTLRREASNAVDVLVTKIEMNKRLATKYQTYNSGHFEIHYPEDVPPVFAEQMGQILEAELKREQKWVSVSNFRPTAVNVVWWRDFRSAYTGSDFILGFYQGKITLPFAGIPGWYPEITAILSHELCHAIITQATNDQAPRWFQEGLAQRVEMVPYKANAFNMYEDDKLLSVSLLDAVLRGSPDPEMIGEAYIVSQTIIRFIESAYGQAGINTMLAAYRDGATTEEAIKKLSGLSVADFDTRLRAWGRSGNKVFENRDIVDYSQHEGNALQWSKPHGGSR